MKRIEHTISLTASMEAPTTPGHYLLLGVAAPMASWDRIRPQMVRVTHNGNGEIMYIGPDIWSPRDQRERRIGLWIGLDGILERFMPEAEREIIELLLPDATVRLRKEIAWWGNGATLEALANALVRSTRTSTITSSGIASRIVARLIERGILIQAPAGWTLPPADPKP